MFLHGSSVGQTWDRAGQGSLGREAKVESWASMCWGCEQLLMWRARLPKSKELQARHFPRTPEKPLWNVCFKWLPGPESWRSSYNFSTCWQHSCPWPLLLPSPIPTLEEPELPGAREEGPSPSTASHWHVASQCTKGKTTLKQVLSFDSDIGTDTPVWSDHGPFCCLTILERILTLLTVFHFYPEQSKKFPIEHILQGEQET